MIYEGSCHCARNLFEAEGDAHSGHRMQLLALQPQGLFALVRSARRLST